MSSKKTTEKKASKSPIGSSFEAFLVEEGIATEVDQTARDRLARWIAE
ncbi:hypothetical protein [Rhizobium sp. BK176]|nr:hypothetical protein [Rhizobium sp. BK176]MCS4089642.1 hypothetical protein [Rhizobium sp. BK176]